MLFAVLTAQVRPVVPLAHVTAPTFMVAPVFHK
jgi:hypothetical protein